MAVHCTKQRTAFAKGNSRRDNIKTTAFPVAVTVIQVHQTVFDHIYCIRSGTLFPKYMAVGKKTRRIALDKLTPVQTNGGDLGGNTDICLPFLRVQIKFDVVQLHA